MEHDTQRVRMTRYIAEVYGIAPEFPWADAPEHAVFRHPASGKWFGVILHVERSRLSLPGAGMADVLNVKCDPLLVGSLRLEPGFLPAYHMNKERWVSVLLDELVPDARIAPLLDMSYELVAPRFSLSKNTVFRQAEHDSDLGRGACSRSPNPSPPAVPVSFA